MPDSVDTPAPDRTTTPPTSSRSPSATTAAEPYQSAGPAIRVTLALCDCPDWSVQEIRTESPALCEASAVDRSELLDTCVLSTPVITSPAASPACAAGVPSTTPAIAAPFEPAEDWSLLSSMPRNAGLPMWIVELAWPLSIWSAILSAVPIGIAYACSAAVCNGLDEPAAVSMPTTWLLALKSGPPESPAWTFASVSMRPFDCSAFEPLSSVAVIVWSRAVTWPGAALGVPPVPPAFPTAVTESPTDTLADEMWAVCSPDASDSFKTATSSVGSVPTTDAL